jgi:hypothetical protein
MVPDRVVMPRPTLESAVPFAATIVSRSGKRVELLPCDDVVAVRVEVFEAGRSRWSGTPFVAVAALTAVGTFVVTRRGRDLRLGSIDGRRVVFRRLCEGQRPRMPGGENQSPEGEPRYEHGAQYEVE